MATTPNRGYQLPAPGSKLKDDVLRLIAALGAIDTDVANLLTTLAGKADLGHGHAMAEITGLVAALGNKLDVGYHDALANLTDVDVAGVANGMTLLRQASKWIPVALQINNIAGLETALSSKATPADITAAINALVAAAPGALDTLNELATALGNDPDFATTVAAALALRVRVDVAQALSTGQQGQARANIGAPGRIKETWFTASGTWNVDPKCLFVEIEAQGAGGGGGAFDAALGAGAAASGGGGGSGAWSFRRLVKSALQASYAVTVGAAGAGTVTSGNSGGSTSVGSLLSAPGGEGGGAYSGGSWAGAGGSAGTGDISIPGARGQHGVYGVQSGVVPLSNGGASRYGATRRSVNDTGLRYAQSNSGPGLHADGYGAGGGGAVGQGSSAGYPWAGGNGSPGLVRIIEFCSE